MANNNRGVGLMLSLTERIEIAREAETEYIGHIQVSLGEPLRDQVNAMAKKLKVARVRLLRAMIQHSLDVLEAGDGED